MITLLVLVGAASVYAAGVRRFDRDHPTRPFPRWHVASFAAGLAATGAVLVGPVEHAAGERFSAHMAQHLVLTLVAPPLVLLGRPITLARRATSGRARRAVLRGAHSGLARLATHPVLAWVALPIVSWATHFTALYDAAIRNGAAHVAEHALYLAAGFLFWFPLTAAEPSPRRLGHAARVLYVAAALVANAFLAVALYGSARLLYPAYAAPAALADQRSAAAIMWIGGALLMVAALLAVVAGWARAERSAVPAYSRASPTSPATSAIAPTASNQEP